MKNLKEYIKESILGDWVDIDANKIADDNISAQRKEVVEFIRKNYISSIGVEISELPNSDGKFEVSSKGDVQIRNSMSNNSLTNGLFVFTKVNQSFICVWNRRLTSLEGAPKEVGGNFSCRYCENLSSLEGAPKEVGGDFDCGGCSNLKSIKGMPKKIQGCFTCYNCAKKFTINDVKKYSKVGGKIVLEDPF